MTTKTKNIIVRILTGLVALIFIGSAFMKLSNNSEALEGASKLGLSPTQFTIVGIIEIVSIILFIIPRTGIIGTLLLAAYMGGAIVTHLEHDQSITGPCFIATFVWVVAFIRFPELSKRILARKLYLTQ